MNSIRHGPPIKIHDDHGVEKGYRYIHIEYDYFICIFVGDKKVNYHLSSDEILRGATGKVEKNYKNRKNISRRTVL